MNIRTQAPAAKVYKRHFSALEKNYGVVSVDFPEEGKPVVAFFFKECRGKRLLL